MSEKAPTIGNNGIDHDAPSSEGRHALDGSENQVTVQQLLARANNESVPSVETPQEDIAANVAEEAESQDEETSVSVASEKPAKRGLKKWAMMAAGLPGNLIIRGYLKLGDRQSKMREKYESLSPEERNKRDRYASLGAAAIGVALYYSRLDHLVTGAASGVGNILSDHGTDTAHTADSSANYGTPNLMSSSQEMIMNGPDPANAPGKLNPFNFGAPLDIGANEQLDAGKFAGYNELVTNRFPNNGNEFASYLANSNIDGAPSPTDSEAINKFGEMLEKDRGMYAEYLEKMNVKLEGATFSEREIVNATYATYEIDPKTGEVRLNPSVTDSTKVVEVTFADGTKWEVCINCGQLKMPGEQVVTETAIPTARGGAPLYFAESIAPRGNGGEVPVKPETPVTPIVPQTPQTPETPTIPHVPELPELPEIPEIPNEEKDYSGGVDTAPGIVPSENGFLGWTPDPSEGNGTDSENLSPDLGNVIDDIAQGAAPNTDPQVETPEAGAGTNRTESDTAAQQLEQQAEVQQEQANDAADTQDTAMEQTGADDAAVREIQAQLGSDGRPR